MPHLDAPGDRLAAELLDISEQLRALSNNGLQWTADPYQIERFHKTLGLAARLRSFVDQQPLPEIRQAFFDDIDFRAPFAVVDTAVFDDEGRLLLIQRADNLLWALPGGACDVGEAAATGGAREVWEETGYICRIDRLLGVFDSRHSGSQSSRHLYHLLFAGAVIAGARTPSYETPDVRWFAAGEVPWTALSPGHEVRIRFALDWYADPTLPPHFDVAIPSSGPVFDA